MDCIDALTIVKHKFYIKKVDVGSKNALDFQLSSYLGFLIASHGKCCKYYIITNDQGYNHLINYWKNKKICVYTVSNILTDNEPLIENINDIVQDYNKAIVIARLITAKKSKSEIYNEMSNRIYNDDIEKGRQMYRLIKKFIK